MATTQVAVRVVDGADVVAESIRRPVRLTPDGFAGVAYGGAVYQLHPPDLIDISESSWELEDCNRFLLTGAPIPYAPDAGLSEALRRTQGFAVDWHVETNRFGHYLVFNSSERLAIDIIEALEGADLSVQRWDASHRMADDGQFYDWFARLRFKGSREEAIVRLTAVMTPAASELGAAEVVRDASDLRIEELETQVEALLDQIVKFRENLASSESEREGLSLTLQRALASESQLKSALDRALDHLASQRDTIDLLRDSARESRDAQALPGKQIDREEMLELALSENAGLNADVAALRGQTDADRQRIRELRAALEDVTARLSELSNQDRERRRRGTPTRGPRVGAEGFIMLAFSRLDFVHDSVEILANFESPSAAMRILTQLDIGEVIGKDLEGLRGWREVSKVATGIPGRENLGRIYYKPDGQRVLVSVHLKQDEKEQRRHVQRLGAL